MATTYAAPVALQDKASRLARILSRLADLLLVVNGDGHIVDVASNRAVGAFIDPYGQAPWEVDPHVTVGAALFGEGHARAIQFDLNFSQLVDGFLPEELVLDQLPEDLMINGRLFQIRVIPMSPDPEFEALVQLTDVTRGAEELARARGNAEFRKVMETLMANTEASRGFFGETRWLLDQLQPDADAGKLARDLHTLKGNLGCFGFEDLSVQVHKTEDKLVVGDIPGALRMVEALRSRWGEQETTFGTLFASRADQEVTLSREEYEEVVMLCMMQADYTELLGEVQRWAMDPVSRVFARLKVQAERAAGHLGKNVQVVIDHNNVRLPATGLQGFWASLVHLIRNAVDHGIETPTERAELGKPEAGVLTMRAELQQDDLVLQFADDGAGINWERVKEQAVSAGLPHDTPADLVDALFSAGVTTAGQVSQTAGRGVGTTAVKQAVVDFGGSIDVDSTRGEGTTFTLRVPLARLATLGLLS